ncbi:MAG: tyrosine-type recombinase/integrase [Candidatus Gracilibacteria bacterium]
MQNTLILNGYLPQNSINKIESFIGQHETLLQNLASRDLSHNSKKALFSDIAHFIVWYEARFKETFVVRFITNSALQAYRDDSEKAGLSPKTIIRRLSSLRELVKEAKELKLLDHEPFRKLKAPQVQPLAPKSLTESDCRKLLREIEIRNNLRDEAIVQLMLGAGLRASEVIALKREDIEITERKGFALIRSGKGNKTRSVPLNSTIRPLLLEYTKANPSEGALFVGQRGGLKIPVTLNKILDFYAKKAGIHCHPHALRHTFAYSYLKHNPSDIVGLAQILGHSNIQTTAIYTQNRLEDLQEKVEF